MQDPFRHHPELRGRIADPDASFFRRLDLGALAAMMDAHGLAKDWWFSDAVREAARSTFLAPLRGADLWVFAYGSLMSDPGFHFAEVRRAHLPGYARRFILLDRYGGRGTPDEPGLMAALDHAPQGPGCTGLIFRIDRDRIEAETERLWQREMIAPGYVPTCVRVAAGAQEIEAVTFVADHAADQIRGDLSRAEQVRYIATGQGILGTSLEYLEKIAAQFSALGIAEPEVTDLLAEVRAFKSPPT